MSVTRVLILGHSFIRRLREYIGRNADLDATLHIFEGIELKWHGVGGRTVLKRPSNFDLTVVEKFMPDIVILQLGTNDLSHLPAVNVGSAIDHFTVVGLVTWPLNDRAAGWPCFDKDLTAFIVQIKLFLC